MNTNRFLVHYVLSSKEDIFKHIHKSIRINLNCVDIVVFSNHIYRELGSDMLQKFNVELVGWTEIK